MTCYCGRYSCPKCGVGKPGNWPAPEPQKKLTPKEESAEIQSSVRLFERLTRKLEPVKKRKHPNRKRMKSGIAKALRSPESPHRVRVVKDKRRKLTEKEIKKLKKAIMDGIKEDSKNWDWEVWL